MNKIGFKNFRRFREFKPIEFRPLTFLVGRNNSGKSTLVKALLLVIDYLKADDLQNFSFNQNNIEDVNIVTFQRALNKTAKEEGDDEINFNIELNGFQLSLAITGNEDSTVADVISFKIDDMEAGFSYLIKPKENSITISNNYDGFEIVPELEESLLLDLVDKQNQITQTLKTIKPKTSQEYILLNSELSQIKKKIKDLRKTISSLKDAGLFQLHSHYNSFGLKDVLQEASNDQLAQYELQFHEIQRGAKAKKSFEGLKAFRESKYKLDRSIDALYEFQTQTETVYLGASLNKQSALFAVRDERNPLAQAIHEFKQLGIDKDQGSEAFKFVRDWIKASEFEIGESFEITMHAGEAYEVIVLSSGLKIPLADKGMGSIQAMLLIIRMANIIYKKSRLKKQYVVVIEEPELNLHPALQSKLADMFHYVFINFGIWFIVETHSEYLIRKTQLSVKENEYEVQPNDNPYCVLYFDKGLTQWNMNYRNDGKFIESFGTGFFDVSANLTFELL